MDLKEMKGIAEDKLAEAEVKLAGLKAEAMKTLENAQADAEAGKNKFIEFLKSKWFIGPILLAFVVGCSILWGITR
jgi:hypothetical protein